MDKKVLCIGEVLWDMIPSGRMIGGAPFNVAYHLNRLNVSVSMLSRIGNDEDGHEILAFLKRYEMDTSQVQIDHEKATSRVNVYYDDTNSVKYDIVFPTAWDFIDIPQEDSTWRDVDYLVFGSLVFRNIVSRDTVMYFLKNTTATRVFDVNLRKPYYSKDLLFDILPYVDVLKLNEEELLLISDWAGIGNIDIDAQLNSLMDLFDIKETILTLGEKGALYKAKDTLDHVFREAKSVEVVDTIGSGDSFLAGFLTRRISGDSIASSMDYAIALAGLVSSKKGGCPDYSCDEIGN